MSAALAAAPPGGGACLKELREDFPSQAALIARALSVPLEKWSCSISRRTLLGLLAEEGSEDAVECVEWLVAQGVDRRLPYRTQDVGSPVEDWLKGIRQAHAAALEESVAGPRHPVWSPHEQTLHRRLLAALSGDPRVRADSTPMSRRPPGAVYLAVLLGLNHLLPDLRFAGFSVEQGDTLEGKTPIHAAVAAGNLAGAEWLLAQGADINAPGTRRAPLARRFSPLASAVWELYKLSRQALLRQVHQVPREYVRNLQRQEEQRFANKTVPWLQGHGARFDGLLSAGVPLVYAEEAYDSSRVLRALLKAGAPAVASRASAVFSVVENASSSACLLLLKAGAVDGWTRLKKEALLHRVAAAGHHPMVLRHVLGQGVAVDARNAQGETPLMSALGGGVARVGMVNAFLAAGADLRGVDKAGNTVLHHAAQGNALSRSSIVHVFMAAGVVAQTSPSVRLDIVSTAVRQASATAKTIDGILNWDPEMQQFMRPTPEATWGGLALLLEALSPKARDLAVRQACYPPLRAFLEGHVLTSVLRAPSMPHASSRL